MKKANASLLCLQQLEFAALETKLYLDIHPNEQMAQRDFTNYTLQIAQQMPIVEKYYGPLTQFGPSQENPARWIEEPWPWELQY